MTRGHTIRVIFTVKICILERSNEKSHFSKTEIYFHKKKLHHNYQDIFGYKIWKLGWKRILSYWHPLLVGLLENTNTLLRLIHILKQKFYNKKFLWISLWMTLHRRFFFNKFKFITWTSHLKHCFKKIVLSNTFYLRPC